MVKLAIQQVERHINDACTRAGRSRSEVTIVAVTKTKEPGLINEAIEAGLTTIGENRIQEYLGKRDKLLSHTFHMIGHLQRNKVRQIIDFVDVIHSVDSVSLAKEIEKRASAAGRTVSVLIEVNISGEESKNGVVPTAAAELAAEIAAMPHLRLAGLMTVAEYTADPEDVRPSFRALRDLRDDLKRQLPQVPLTELSMGMTNDYSVAIEEGATMVRLGTALFGVRNTNQ